MATDDRLGEAGREGTAGGWLWRGQNSAPEQPPSIPALDSWADGNG